MATHKPTPLRDRLLSNSPDPIKSSILRESGMGWASSGINSIPSSSSSGSITSPLRIAKRDSQAIQRGVNVARRSSSSFNHVRENNLVSKSPFKTQLPAPTTPSRPASVAFPTRRVSGEKRPRPSSMHEDAETENDRPFSLKRDRKQSRTFQGLLEKEPVTKSPFKKLERLNSMEIPSSPPLVPKIAPMPNLTPITSRHTRFSSEPPAPTTGPSPGRSSLVSRRLHGPRLSGGGRRERRKTVTFDERCDVVEFDCETSDEEFWEGSDDGEPYGEPDQDAEEEDPFFRGEQMDDEPPRSELPAQLAPDVSMQDESYDSAHLSDNSRSTPTRTLLDPEASITGLVEEIFFSSNAELAGVEALEFSTSHVSDIPTDLETEDGVPFERTHNTEHLSYDLQHESAQDSPLPRCFSPRASPHSSTSVRQSPQIEKPNTMHRFGSPSPNLGLPLDFSTTPSRVSPMLAQSTPPISRPPYNEHEETQELEAANEAESHFVNSSPVQSTSAEPTRGDGLIPKYMWPRGSQYIERGSPSVGAESFSLRERSFEDRHRASSDSLDPANLSIGHSEVSLNGLNRSEIYHSGDEGPPSSVLDTSSLLKDEPNPEYSASSNASRASQEGHEDEEILAGINDNSSGTSSVPSPRSEPPPHVTSPPIPITSPLNLSQSSSSSRAISPRPNIHHRISKDNIRRRLTERRSTLSPSPEPVTQLDSVMERIESFPTSEAFTMKVEEPQPPEATISRHDAAEVESLDHDRDRDCMSISTAISTETATVQCAEKFNVAGGLPTPDSLSDKEFGLLHESPSIQLNFGSKFSLGGMGLTRSNSTTSSRDPPDTLSRGHETDRGSVHSGASVKVGDVDVSMDAKSALDRLMDDVAGQELDNSFDQSLEILRPSQVQRAATDSDLLHMSDPSNRIVYRPSTESIPPPPPPKDNNIKAREQLILEKRREARRAEEGGFAPMRNRGQRLQAQLGVGRPSRRRSMSAGDAQDLAKRQLLSVDRDMEKLAEEDLLSQSIERELRKLNGENSEKKSKYQVREHEGTIYASASDNKVSHMPSAGDLETGRAWRTVRRPSDMNEYSRQIKEYRLQANPAKAYGKVFVKVLGIKGVHLPLPQETSTLTCTLNNGIHFVTTPECELGPDCRIDQEFELIEHSKLEFTLTLKIRRDPHITAQFKALAPTPVPPPPPPPVVQQSSSRGMRAFFSSSPRKSKEKAVRPPPPPPPVHRLPENLARYLKPDGTLARAFIQFKDIATRCDTRLFETNYPLIGQRAELGGKFSTLQVGEIILQIFRLPPLPGIPPDQLPQSLEECHRGLRHINWHKVTYFEGILTQNGGDCNTWRRRLFRVIGANLVAFNDITKKATATIDLKKAIAVQDDQDLRNPLSPLARSRGYDEDALFGVERSFRLVFPQEQEIIFFADTDEEKYRWLEVFRALVGHIPPHPLWAELLWQRQEETSKRTENSNDQIPEPAAQGTTGTGQL
ncbi:hypothetical protein D9756_007598 [Leucocoprinus leucothites]|uniref:PH domain-containing protein n=1 Tax=Leucocoprinus leucothites TaxID=201217 RepID=A0A8H5FX33_9AGAR|nr:hypothetical protein D9756_007598 [Leucoagaricus leucothites]